MGKAEECPGKDDGQSGRKGARQGSGGSKKCDLTGRGVSAQKLNFHAKSQKRQIRMKK